MGSTLVLLSEGLERLGVGLTSVLFSAERGLEASPRLQISSRPDLAPMASEQRSLLTSVGVPTTTAVRERMTSVMGRRGNMGEGDRNA